MRVPLAVVLAVVFQVLGGSTAAATNESCMPSPSSFEDGPPCPSCCAMQQLPLQQWSEESTTTSFQLPWGQQYPFPALDYQEIADTLCDCLDTGDELPEEPPEAFVSRNGTHFFLHGRPFHFFGFNHPALIRYAAGNDSEQHDYLVSLLEHAVDLGMTVGRSWAHYEGYDLRAPDAGGDPFPFISLQMAPGQYNETTFQALDELLVLAREMGLRLILSLSDFTGALGTGKAGFEPYLMWVKGSINITGMTSLDFFTDERVKLLFKANLCAMANRVNSITGVKYKHDPTIFAWEMMNEPVCMACPGPTLDEVLHSWIQEMTAFMKCVDPTHMASVGLGGGYGVSTPWRLTDNPGPWAVCFGEDFSRFVSLPSMDYGVAHMYENNRGSWNDSGREPCGYEDCLVQWYRDWIQGHIDESTHRLQKPFILEEFGLAYDESRRNQMFRIVREVFREVREADPRSAAAGAMFWLPALAGEPNTDGLNVYLDGSTAPYPTQNQYGAQRSKSTQEWLDSLQVMQGYVRRAALKDACMAQAKLDLHSIYDNQELKMYSSNSTVALLSDTAVEFAALGPALAVDALLEGNSVADSAVVSATEGDLTCPPCPLNEGLPLRQWVSEAPLATRLPWGQDVLFDELDYVGAATVVCNCLTAEESSDQSTGAFVGRQGTRFQLGGHPFYFTGFNAWQLPQLVYSNRSAVAHSLLAQAAQLGFQVGRIFVPGDGPDTRMPSERALVQPYGGVWSSLQKHPGSFDEAVFQALDEVIAQAEHSSIRLILVLGSHDSNLGYGGPGTPLQYMQWITGSYNMTGLATVQDFYTDERAKLLFKSFICTLLHRVNTVTGRRYRDDPTIMAWELMEAPKCPGCEGNATGEVLTAWVDEMSRFVKCVDPNHLVSVAQQGFYGPFPEDRITVNPSLATYCSGADFVELSSLPAVDYATVQVYEYLKQYNEVGPANCGWTCHMQFFREWLEAHLNDTAALVGKPLVVEEVGKNYHEDKRNQLFDLVRTTLLQDFAANSMSPAAGFLFNGANIGGQVDWGGSSIYLDGSLPLPGPERYQALPQLEQDWMLEASGLQDYFHRMGPAAECSSAMSAQLSSVYNTTALKLFESNSTLEIIKQLSTDAASS